MLDSGGGRGVTEKSFPDEVIESFAPYLAEGERDPALIAGRFVSGPVPLHLLLGIAGRIGFPGLPLIEGAARGIEGGLFAEGRGTAQPSGGHPVRTAPAAGGLRERDATAASDGHPAGVTGGPGALFERIFELLGERRGGQLEMAGLVERILADGGVALVEAGTGTGKSLAYLVPSLHHALVTGGRVVVSTHTKNLQDQLVNREIPVLFEAAGRSVPVERLMGRESYICARSALSRVIGLAEEDPLSALRTALAVSLSRDGRIEGLPLPPASTAALAAPPRCRMNACPHAATCPLLRARSRAREASILFVNHALLLSDYRQERTVIGPYDRVILDEAHHLERCIMENLSVKVQRVGLDGILDRIEPIGAAEERWRFLFHRLEREGGAGRRDPDAIAGTAAALRDSYRAFFASLDPLGGGEGTRTRYYDGAETFANSHEHINDILIHINMLKLLLKPLLDIELPAEETDFQQDLGYVSDELAELGEALRFVTEASDEGTVFWLEWERGGRLREIRGAPLVVDRLFADYLDEVCEGAVLTSATLTEQGSFGYIAERLGLGLSRRTLATMVVESPFDLAGNCRIILEQGGGDPNTPGFSWRIASLVERLVTALGRRTMVLFTSYRMCLETAARLEEAGVGVDLFVQGRGRSREALAEGLRSSANGVLLGVASFWEGVDFPGSELEVLVIPKLPFPVPTEPIVEARAEMLERAGENPFERLSLPEAILRLRQGIGRLIRRGDDRGVVVLMDPRLTSRAYGAAVLGSLPVPAGTCSSIEEVVDAARAFFACPQHDSDCSGPSKGCNLKVCRGE